MAYADGTYIAFHAQGTNIPTASDIKYYNLMKAWTEKEEDDFFMINSHHKTSAVRDDSLRETLRRRLVTRLRNSKHLVLIVSKYTKDDTDWVPFEIEYAIDVCKLPLIVTYPNYNRILKPVLKRDLWPYALEERIDNNTVKAIHIPFKKEPLKAAIHQFNRKNQPPSPLSYYSKDLYKLWGITS